MDLRSIAGNVEDQDRGRWFDLADPVTGQPVGIRFRIAGPDSATQRRAELKLSDELAALAGPDGRVSAENRETARINALARCVLAWEIEEDGAAVPFTHENVVRVLRMARWLEQEVDAFASDRAGFQ
jgi:hypothetical protein